MVATKTTTAKATVGSDASSGSKKGTKAMNAKKPGVGAAGRQPGMKRSTTSSQAKLCLPVARVLKYIKKGRYADNVSKLYVVTLTGILEFVTAELLLAGIEKARLRGRKRVTPRDLMLAVKDDEEFSFLLKNVQIAEAGVVPKIHDELRSRKALSKVQAMAGTVKKVAPKGSTAGAKDTAGAKGKGSQKGTKQKVKPVDDVEMADEEDEDEEVGDAEEDQSDEDAEMEGAEEEDEDEGTGKGREISQDY